jgi:signal peptidase I
MKTLFYKGPSMNPTLRVPDVLHIEPCENGRIREGDVIVFTAPNGRGNVAHRVVSVYKNGTVQTRGDNNEEIDAYEVSPSKVIGRVTHATRRGNRRTVHGGVCGRLIGMGTRCYLGVRNALVCGFRPVYEALSGRLAFNWLTRWMNIRVIHYSRHGRPKELHLLMRNRCIGRLLPGQIRWRITPPFKFFVDEESLPRGFPPD